MGLFQTIGDLANTGYQKSRRKLERAAANKAIADIRSQKEWRLKEDPREQAHLNQSLWGRGLGKSSIADQDKERLTFMQQNRMAGIERAEALAIKQKRYLKRKHKHEKISMWLGLLDGIISLAAGAGGGGQPQLGGANTGGGYEFGGAGDYNYGAGGSFYA